MDNFWDKVMSSIALSLIFITLCMSLAWNIWSQQTCRWHHLWRVPCRRGGGAVPPPRPGRSRRRRSREPSVCPGQREWRRNHVLVDLSIFVTMSSTAGSFSFTLSVPGQDTQSHFCTAPFIQGYHILSLIFSSKQTVTVFGTFLPLRTENTSGMDVTTQIVVNYCKLSINNFIALVKEDELWTDFISSSFKGNGDSYCSNFGIQVWYD